jgi:hypothetical protein
MKVLFLDHPEADYLAAILYTGLCQELGPENVVDWPRKCTYHGENYEGPIPYPPHTGVSSPFDWFQAQPNSTWTDQEIYDRAHEFDLVILASPRAYNVAALDDLIARCGRAALKRFVFVDGEDYTTNRWDLIDRFRPSVYFKLSVTKTPFEIYVEQKPRLEALVRIVPFPLASPVHDVPSVPKEFDVAFFGGDNWQSGGPAARAALSIRLAAEFPNIVDRRASHAEFISSVAKAKIAVSVGGWGTEPLRTYEILSCPDTLLVREDVDSITPYPFVNGVVTVNFNVGDVEEIVRSVGYYLHHEEDRRRIAQAGNEFLQKHYTPQARARQLLEEAFA